MARELRARALLFDCDGVLVDSRAAGEAAWSEWADSLGVPSDRVLDGLHGHRSEDTVRRHVAERHHREALELIERLELRGATATREIPGAAQLLGSAITRSAVVTSAAPALLSARLTAAGIPMPEVVVTGHDVLRGKPAPEPYLLAADRLGVDPADCIVLEDSPAGIASARAAGVGVVIGVGESAVGADILVPDLTPLTWTGEALAVRP